MKRVLFILITVSVLAGCATERQQRAATTGAIVGATAGAVIGSQSDRTAQGAIIGGILGGLAGAVLAGDGSDQVYASGPTYHRRACPRGERYFESARRARDPHRRVVLLRQGLRYCPNNPAAYNDLGVALIIIGDDAGAREHFRHALRLDPGYEPARRNLMTVERRDMRRQPMPSYQPPGYQEQRQQSVPQRQRQQPQYQQQRRQEPATNRQQPQSRQQQRPQQQRQPSQEARPNDRGRGQGARQRDKRREQTPGDQRDQRDRGGD